MTEAEIIALLAEALPALVEFVESKFISGQAGADIVQATKDISGWFATKKFDLSAEVTAVHDAGSLEEDLKFGKK